MPVSGGDHTFFHVRALVMRNMSCSFVSLVQVQDLPRVEKNVDIAHEVVVGATGFSSLLVRASLPSAEFHGSRGFLFVADGSHQESGGHSTSESRE